MKKAAVFFAGTCLMALVFFCACGQGNVPKSNQAQTQSSTSAQGTSRSGSSSSVSEVPTYSLDQVKRLCNKAILLEKGQIISRGSIEEVSKVYEEKTK